MKGLLENQVALVTGGSSGIGKAIALKFIESGAKVAIFGSNAEKGALAIAEIQHEFKDAEVAFFAVNVADHVAVQQATQLVLEKFGKVDILINNAGITKDQLLMKMSEEDWDSVMDVNVKSCFNLSKSLVRSMLKAKKGKIINISSVIGLMGNAGQANYASSKAAMIGFTKALAKELGSRNICVNCLAPGFISTQMTEALSDAQKASLMQNIPLGRFGDPMEVANAALFLASYLGDYITGQVIAVDGGMTMH
jgi:3-oxoacyl-[acyl-carrier protein] reductase